MPARRRGAGRIGGLVGVVVLLVALGCTPSNDQGGGAPATTAGSGPSGPTSPSAAAVRTGGVLRLGAVGIDTLDPADTLLTNPSAMVVADALFDPLTVGDPISGEARPAVAASWSANPELTEWTFTIRDGARFSDGSPITARDAVLSLARLARRGRASVPGARLGIIEGVDEFAAGKTLVPSGMLAVDARTVRLTTTTPFAGLADLLTSPVYGIVPEKAVNAAAGTFGQQPVTSGPFAFASRQDDGTVRLVKAPGSPARLDGMDVVPFDDEAAAYGAFADGRVDWAPVPAGKADAARAGGKGTVEVKPSTSVVFVAVNTRQAALADQSARVALAQAVDRKAVVAATPGTSPLAGLVPVNLPGWSPGEGCGAACTYDAGAAAAGIAAANLPALRLTYYDEADDATGKKAATVLVGQWQAVGANVSGDPKPFDEARSYVLGPDVQLFIYGWIGVGTDPDAWLAPLVQQGSPGNVTGWTSPEEDQTLAVARSTADRPARLRAYAEVQRKALAGAAMVPLGSLDVAVVEGRNLVGANLRWDGTFDVVTAGFAA